MLDEARFLRNHSKGLRLASLLKNPILQRSFIRSFEVLGEASKIVSPEFKGAHPEVDWRNIGGLRDRLIHHYSGSIGQYYGTYSGTSFRPLRRISRDT